jgi:hypothetical protein
VDHLLVVSRVAARLGRQVELVRRRRAGFSRYFLADFDAGFSMVKKQIPRG